MLWLFHIFSTKRSLIPLQTHVVEPVYSVSHCYRWIELTILKRDWKCSYQQLEIDESYVWTEHRDFLDILVPLVKVHRSSLSVFRPTNRSFSEFGRKKAAFTIGVGFLCKQRIMWGWLICSASLGALGHVLLSSSDRTFCSGSGTDRLYV